MTWGDDLGAEDESLLVADYDRPVFVMNYPKEAKAFYMKENPDDPRTVLCDDLLAPEGYGEIIGGSAARGRLRQAAPSHPRGGAARRRVRLVSRPAQVRHVRALRLRPRARAHGRVDLRAAAHSRGDRVPADDAPARDPERCAPAFIALLGALHLVPQRVEHRDAGARRASMPRSRGERLDALEAARELVVRAVERERRVHAGPSAEIDARRRAGRPARPRGARARVAALGDRRPALRRSSSRTSRQLFLHLVARAPRCRPSRSRRRRRAPAAGYARCSAGRAAGSPSAIDVARSTPSSPPTAARSPSPYRCGCRARIFVMSASATSCTSNAPAPRR